MVGGVLEKALTLVKRPVRPSETLDVTADNCVAKYQLM